MLALVSYFTVSVACCRPALYQTLRDLFFSQAFGLVSELLENFLKTKDMP